MADATRLLIAVLVFVSGLCGIWWLGSEAFLEMIVQGIWRP